MHASVLPSTQNAPPHNPHHSGLHRATPLHIAHHLMSLHHTVSHCMAPQCTASPDSTTTQLHTAHSTFYTTQHRTASHGPSHTLFLLVKIKNTSPRHEPHNPPPLCNARIHTAPETPPPDMSPTRRSKLRINTILSRSNSWTPFRQHVKSY